MFLTDKIAPAIPFLSGAGHKNSTPAAQSAAGFELTLAVRLRSLLPVGDGIISLAWLARAADVLAATLSDAASQVRASSSADADDLAAASASPAVAVLDACNAVIAAAERHRRRRLLARFALHLLSLPPSTSSLTRARDALTEWGDARSAPAPVQPASTLPSASDRVAFAVVAVLALVTAAASTALGLEGAGKPSIVRVPPDFPWAEAYSTVAGELQAKINGVASEVAAGEETVKNLIAVLDGGKQGEITAPLAEAVKDASVSVEELTAGLDRLGDAVNAVFRAALGLRNAEMDNLRFGPWKCQ